MNRLTLTLVVLSLLGIASTVAISQDESSAPRWNMDPVHSSVNFRIRHLGAGYVYGRFNNFRGFVNLDPANPAGGKVDLTIAANSVDTGNGMRDRHLQNPDFFNAPQFPQIRFVSTSVESAGPGAPGLNVTGDLTLLGTTKSITIPVKVLGTGRDRDGKELLGLLAEFSINRSDFGMTYGIDNGGAGDQVDLQVAIEAGKQ